jgi:hypothetical protein
MLVHEGQIMFVARANPRDDTNSVWAGHVTSCSLQHLNQMADVAYGRARHKLVTGLLPEGIQITAEQFDELSEAAIMEYFGSRQADIPANMPKLKAACQLMHIQEFKYLLPGTMMMFWNLYGGVNNIK